MMVKFGWWEGYVSTFVIYLNWLWQKILPLPLCFDRHLSFFLDETCCANLHIIVYYDNIHVQAQCIIMINTLVQLVLINTLLTCIGVTTYSTKFVHNGKPRRKVGVPIPIFLYKALYFYFRPNLVNYNDKRGTKENMHSLQVIMGSCAHSMIEKKMNMNYANLLIPTTIMSTHIYVLYLLILCNKLSHCRWFYGISTFSSFSSYTF